MWPARGGVSGSDAFEEVGDLLQALLLVWSVSEKDVAGKVRRKVRRKRLPAWWRSDGDEVVRSGSGRK